MINQVASEIGVEKDILTHNLDEDDGLLIGKIIMLMDRTPRSSILLKLDELIVSKQQLD